METEHASTLSLRDHGNERLSAHLPVDPPAGRDALRQLAIAITRLVSRWQIEHAKARDLAKKGARNG